MINRFEVLCRVIHRKDYVFERMKNENGNRFVMLANNRLSNYILRTVARLGYEIRQNKDEDYVIAWPMV